MADGHNLPDLFLWGRGGAPDGLETRLRETTLKAHLHANLRSLECQYLEYLSPKNQDYDIVISCNSFTQWQIIIIYYIPDTWTMASLCSSLL